MCLKMHLVGLGLDRKIVSISCSSSLHCDVTVTVTENENGPLLWFLYYFAPHGILDTKSCTGTKTCDTLIYS